MRYLYLALFILLWICSPCTSFADHHLPTVMSQPNGLVAQPRVVVTQPMVATLLTNDITVTAITPSRPAVLSLGEQVTIVFKYTKIYPGNVKITAQPFAGDQPMGSSSSPLYTDPSGVGLCAFTVPQGENRLIDEVQLVMTDEQGRNLLRKEISVRLLFSEEPLSAASSAEQTILPDGSLEFKYPDGSSLTLKNGGKTQVHRTPDGQESISSMLALTYAPTIPSPEADQSAWIEYLNDQLEQLGNSLYSDIAILCGGEETESFNNYLAYETEECETMYERINLRQRYIALMLRSMF